ncbi:2-amino-4-hydroxy-6-hydroxymethyldihydropteridine diphosphokinase [Pseudidiomarina homiensis]|uniref:2-amino-4-hydroxy-6-hydroxymethyldihydropteridine diphosphokinase n=1 Tax=Pseudidiomarina homiensis TaxID=364198 RepID=A0A432Y2S3_9GAMM|nr:2-amino-4-hydroxy-6-hydroxymethyldihydropteridine diphosphokinase [Pseudidiomarina homiensis]RUO55248.1 2-amino-4-hydroxy-6-hydroxymethyldihydropteridine diphosphokinase [Pseudidiomarina homiensis]
MAVVYLGLGSNRDRSKHIRAGLRALHDTFASAAHPLRVSRVYESAAVGFDGHDFYNTVVEFRTDLSLQQVVQTCKAIEQAHGHPSNVPKYSPRTLDIDVLLYDDFICRQPIQLPRGEVLKNAFVLWPLAELAPALRHPETGISFAEHWQSYASEQRLKPLDFAFEPLPYLLTP